MRLFLLLIFFTTLSELAYTKNDDDIDSLYQNNEQTETDKEKVDALIDLYNHHFTNNSDSALYYADKALQISNRINYLEGQILSLTNIGSVYFYKGELGIALKNYLQSNELIENYIEEYKQDDFANHQLSKTLNNIGLIYLRQQKFEEAEKYMLESLEIDLELGNPISISQCYNNLGTIKENLNDYEKAIEYYTKAYDIKVSEKSEKEIPSTLINIGVVRMNEGSYYEADTCFKKAVELSQKIKNNRDLCLANINLGDLNYTQKRFNEAIAYYFSALDIAKAHNYLGFLSYIYESISLSYTKQQNYKGAYDYYVLFTETKDKINSDENRKLINEIQTKYETEKKEKEISLLNKEKALKDIELKNSKLFLIVTVVGLILISAFLTLLFFLYKQKQKTNAQIQIKNDKLEAAYATVEEKNTEILDSINYAKRIQNAILPQEKLVKQYLPNSFVLYKPKDIVAGDFYWMEQKDDMILFAAADCTGHGVPGAMVSVVCNNGLNRSVREYGISVPSKILDKTKEIVLQEFEKSEEGVKDGMDISLCSLSLSSQKLCWAGANNPLWIIRKDANEIEEIKANKQPIGKHENPMPYTNHEFTLQKGDSIYVFTDGFPDQFGGENNKKFKTANFKKLLLQIQNKTMEEQKLVIDKAFEDWKSDFEQVDDVCVIGVRL